MENSKKITINIDYEIYHTHASKKYENKTKWEKPDNKNIKSEIPGTIIEILVKEGQKVKEGDTMVIIQAMKMNNKILFTANGTVDKIWVKIGDVIPKGANIISLTKE